MGTAEGIGTGSAMGIAGGIGAAGWPGWTGLAGAPGGRPGGMTRLVVQRHELPVFLFRLFDVGQFLHLGLLFFERRQAGR